jgi:Cys-rich protein (TIGR01571 family)
MSKPWTFSTIAPTEAMLPLSTGAKVDVPLGRWRKGLFECFSNCGMCLCVCCCSSCTIGQVASIARNGAGWICLLTVFAILALNAGASGLQYVYSDWVVRWTAALSDERVEIGEPQEWMGTVSLLLISLASLIACLCVFSARMKYRARDKIPGECCGSGILSDCLSAWCCSPCAVVQMFSQDEIGFPSGDRSYRLFWSPYGEPLKPIEVAKPAEAV